MWGCWWHGVVVLVASAMKLVYKIVVDYCVTFFAHIHPWLIWHWVVTILQFGFSWMLSLTVLAYHSINILLTAVAVFHVKTAFCFDSHPLPISALASSSGAILVDCYVSMFLVYCHAFLFVLHPPHCSLLRIWTTLIACFVCEFFLVDSHHGQQYHTVAAVPLSFIVMYFFLLLIVVYLIFIHDTDT